MATFLLTGAAGFVGINLSLFLLAGDHAVIGVDVSDRHGRLAASSLLNHGRFRFVPLRLSGNAMISFPSKVTAIVHLAALPHVDYSVYRPQETITNNIGCLLNVLEIAVREAVPVIFASSQECYGGAQMKVYDESDALQSLSPYAASKVAGEAIVSSYVATRGLKATIVRFANLYGPWQAPDRIIPRIIGQLMLGFAAEVEEGTQRDFLFVQDACKAIGCLLGEPYKGEVFNVSSGTALDNALLGSIIADLLESTRPPVRLRRVCDGRGQFLAASPKKLERTTNWSPTTPVEAGLKVTVEWYRANRSWLLQFSQQLRSRRFSPAFLSDLKWDE